MRSRVVLALRSLGAFAVENPLLKGTPDIAHRLGWIELKSEPEWPARPDTPLRVRHFTQEQRLWHTMWRDAGGASLVVLRVGRADWIALDGATAAAQLGRATRAELADAAYAAWWGQTPTDEWIELCTREHSAWRATNGQRAAAQRDAAPPA